MCVVHGEHICAAIGCTRKSVCANGLYLCPIYTGCDTCCVSCCDSAYILLHCVPRVEVFCQGDGSVPRVEVEGFSTDHGGQFQGKKLP